MQAIMRNASPEQALDIPLAAPGSRRSGDDVLSTYIITDLVQRGGSPSGMDLEGTTMEARCSSDKDKIAVVDA